MDCPSSQGQSGIRSPSKILLRHDSPSCSLREPHCHIYLMLSGLKCLTTPQLRHPGMSIIGCFWTVCFRRFTLYLNTWHILVINITDIAKDQQDVHAKRFVPTNWVIFPMAGIFFDRWDIPLTAEIFPDRWNIFLTVRIFSCQFGYSPYSGDIFLTSVIFS